MYCFSKLYIDLYKIISGSFYFTNLVQANASLSQQITQENSIK